jgi:hypothetical protein
MTVFFRFDDFSATSPEAVETGLVDALRANHVCATFAVIPAVTEGSYHLPGERATFPLGPDKIRFLRDAVALWMWRCTDGITERSPRAGPRRNSQDSHFRNS